VTELEKDVRELFDILREGGEKVSEIEEKEERAYERNAERLKETAEKNPKALGAFIMAVTTTHGKERSRVSREILDRFLQKAKEIAKKHNVTVVYSVKVDYDYTPVYVGGRNSPLVTWYIERVRVIAPTKQGYIEYNYRDGREWTETLEYTSFYEGAKVIEW